MIYFYYLLVVKIERFINQNLLIFNMGIAAYHGTGKLGSIIKDKAIYCPQLVGYSKKEIEDLNFFSFLIKKYEEETKKIAEIMRKNYKKEIKEFYKHPINSDEELADLAFIVGNEMNIKFKCDLSDYKESIRVYHVFLTPDFELAKKYAINDFPAVLEFDLPKNIIRPQLIFHSNSILVKKEVDLDYLTRLWVKNKDMEKTESLLENYGLSKVPLLNLN